MTSEREPQETGETGRESPVRPGGAGRLRFPRWSARLLPALLAVLLFAGCPWKHRKADLILKNGTFFTGNPMKPAVEMVAIRGNRIIGLGRTEDAKRYQSDQTRVIDLRGKFGCAGFNDAHLHLLYGGQSLEEVDLTGVTNIHDLQRRILERAWKIPWGSWIIGGGWDQNQFPNGEWPTKRALDDVAADFPMVLRRVCGHAVLVNSKVLAIAGITAKTPDPPAGEIMRDPVTGEPTGVLKEDAVKLVSQYMPAATEESISRSIERALEEAKRFGVTGVQDFSAPEAYPVYRRLLAEGRLTARVSCWMPLDSDPSAVLERKAETRSRMLRVGCVKGILDGSMGARTAALNAPYSDDSTTSGLTLYTQDRLNELVLLADRNRLQVALHAIGDRAAAMALTSFELARKINGQRESRHRIEHAQVLAPSDFEAFKSLGIVASMQPAHCIYDLPWAESRLGPVRSEGAYAWKSVLDAGGRLAFGSDWPVVPLNPLIGIYAAVTRSDTAGLPGGGWTPRQRLTAEEAITAYTLGSAYAEFMEHELGSLEQGKLADLVVLNRNLLTVHPADILRARVVYTIVDGKIVYEEDP
ncbi:MAG: amidohydrolase [bacterium]|nr:amidohydrolase [bacterium]